MKSAETQESRRASAGRTGRKSTRTRKSSGLPSDQGTLSTNRPRAVLVLGGMFAALLLVGAGILFLKDNQVTGGAIAVVVGVALFTFSSRSVGAMPWSADDTNRLLRSWLPSALAVLGGFFAALSAFEVSQPRLPAALWQSSIYWILGLVAFAAGILWLERWLPHPIRWIAWIRANYLECLLAAGIVVLALLARLYALSYHPYPWSGDEATVGMTGQQLMGSRIPDLFNAGWSGNPLPAFYLTALLEAVLGYSILAVRVASAVVGTLSVLFLYLAGREFFGRAIALLSAGFLAALPYHLQFSRVGVLTIQDTLVVALVLWLIVRAVRKDQLRAYMYAGLASGLTVYAYVGGRLVLALAVCAVALVVVTQKGYLRTHIRHLLVYGIGIFVALAPMGVFFLNHLQDFGSRFVQVSIIQSGWLVRTSAQTGRSVLSLLGDQFINSTLVYIAAPAYGSFFNSPQPYLTLVAALLFLLGMGVAFQKIRQAPYALLLIWFWSVIFLGGVLTISPPANTRMIMTAPAMALFVAIGISKVLEILVALRVPGRWLTAGTAVLMAGLILQGALFYFGPYRAGHYFDDANAEVAMQAGLELRGLGPDYNFIMIGLPRMFSGFPTVVFLDPQNPRTDIQPADAATADLSGKLPAFIVATPDNLAPLQQIAGRFPGGKFETVPSQSRNETLYYAYIVSSPTGQTVP